MTPRVMVVEDEEALSLLLRYNLESEGYAVDTVIRGDEAETRLRESVPDLVILDWMLPGLSGIELCRRLRTRPETERLPVIMLTARGDETDRVVGLEMGADDYVAKPFSARELLARIKVVLRRVRSLPPNLQPDERHELLFAGWCLDTVKRHLVSPDGVVVPLSGAEYRLLRIFLAHPSRVLTRDQLVDMTQGREADPLDRSIDVQVSRLRQRLGDDPRGPAMIKTVRGEGYVLAANVDALP